jgi:UDP-glucose 4-epimerase
MSQNQVCSVIVLGAAGFVGRHVCRTLAEQGVEVIGLGHGNWDDAQWRSWGLSRWINADITADSLQAAWPGPGKSFSVIHCAGSGAVSYAYLQPLDDFERAVHTTAQLLEWTRRHETSCQRVVVVSSAAVYGDQGNTNLTENCVRAPISPYGFNKTAAELLCESYSRFFNVKVSIVRLFSVYGEGLKKQLLWDACNKFHKGMPQFFGTGDEMRDWIHVTDAAALLCAAAQPSPSQFDIYNGGHEQRSTSNVLHTLGTCFEGHPVPTFTGETHVGNPRRLTSDSGHAMRQLSWRPCTVLTDALPRYVHWFKKEIAR